MKTKRAGLWIWIGILVLLILAAGVCALTPAGRYAQLLVGFVLDSGRGPNIVDSAWSPNMEFEAYVLEWASIDPPNQTLYIQQRDEQHFVVVAQLGEDVDSIRSIIWSPTGDMVVFHTHSFLYAVHAPGYEMAAISLADEFFHFQPGKFGTYGGGIPEKSVTEVSFPEPGDFAYQLAGEDSPRIVHMAKMLGYQP